MKRNVVALDVSDLHLWHKPPIWRSAEPDWFAAQARPLDEVNALAKKHCVPVLCAGDVFDKHNAIPETIDFAITHLRGWYSVVGQHDLPHHNYGDLQKSAFWIVCRAGALNLLSPDEPTEVGGVCPLRLWGYSWGYHIHPLEKQRHDLVLDIAVVHDTFWTARTSFPDAPKEKRLKGRWGEIAGYDFVVSGDNHKSFVAKTKNGTIVNAGSLMRRNSDQINHKPACWLLYGDGTAEPHYLDISQDKYLSPMETAEAVLGLGTESQEFVKELNALTEAPRDYKRVLRQRAQEGDVPKGVRRRVLTALENEK